jgi:hypothetical protein
MAIDGVNNGEIWATEKSRTREQKKKKVDNESI